MPTVFVTGANRGIGLGLVKAYLKKGYKVLATCRDAEHATDLKGLKGDIEIHKLDVTDTGAVSREAAELADVPIDILINNAGVLGGPAFNRDHPGQTFGTVDYGGLRFTLETNTIAPLIVTEAFTPNLEKGSEKKVITITSRMGSISEMEGEYLAYRASKAAVNAIMKNISHPLKEKGIAVAVLHPGWVRTDMGSQAAPLSIEESVEGLVKVIDGLTLSETGCFKNHLGEAIPW